MDLDFPQETVWRALTDRDVLDQWFLPGGWALARGAVFQLRSASGTGAAGLIDVEVLEVVAGQRLVMQWTGPTLHTEMTWSLLPRPAGCRLSVVQSGFLGTPQSVRALELRTRYWQMFGSGLPAVLSGQRVTSPTVGTQRRGPRQMWAHAVMRLRANARVVRWRYLGRAAPWSMSVAAVLAVAAAAALWVSLHPHHDPSLSVAPTPGASAERLTVGALPSALRPAGQNGPGGSPAAGGSSPTGGRGAGSSLGAAPASAGATSPTTAGGGPASGPGRSAGQVTGAYQTTKVSGEGNYRGQITLTASSATINGWTVVITVPDGAGVNNVTGASFAQNGDTITFTPNGNARITPGAPVVIDFKVLRPAGTTAPLSCLVNDRPCA